jgi:hypothetical protein
MTLGFLSDPDGSSVNYFRRQLLVLVCYIVTRVPLERLDALHAGNLV